MLGACLIQPGEVELAAEVASTAQEIVAGQPNTGDPHVGLLWLGGGSCSGTLVAPQESNPRLQSKIFLTARHCVVDASGNQARLADLRVYWGEQPNNASRSNGVVDYRFHPAADIAALTLDGYHDARPVALNQQALEPLVGQRVRIAGYGVTLENNRDSGLKRVGNTTLVGFDQTELGSVAYIGQQGSKTCYGDSGGPAFMKIGDGEKLVGVTSFGTGPCESGDTLDGEVRADVYHDWIVAYINEKDPAPPRAASSQAGGTGAGGDETTEISGGCRTGGGAGSGPLAGLALLALGLRGRRRRPI
jgi:MYXO-CTERM domain-containing protein